MMGSCAACAIGFSPNLKFPQGRFAELYTTLSLFKHQSNIRWRKFVRGVIPVASKCRVTKAVAPNTLNYNHEKSRPDQLGDDRNVKRIHQPATVRQAANQHRRNGHGEKVHEQVVETEGGGMSARRNQVMDR